eukprot:CAMPEP_0185031938 /NCGR_PEP_ID=MMETSP1103-20130426/19685_1 /TAXON_ID=36769 /ORGANISM="Paraphysomonas bandaiensis, Strain Caron Lab Isolate" /LENGTH=521 /DNA_ID=CAMNT_0027567639 /DNA_START=31 /DNA_END=1593 /DNA_ORIENTATION=-
MNTTNDQLQEKKINLENELRRVQIELVEVLNLNDNLTLENKEKDDTISRKEQQLMELKDKDAQDIEQLKTERKCMVDYYEHEFAVLNDSIKRIELLRDRYNALLEENAVIQSSVERLKEQMSAEGLEHAKEVHETNAGMRVMREQMEATFRKELVEMDLVFQRQAFTAMDDHKKKAMLANSKLKDELALQSVGISNLSVRCARDKQSYKSIKQDMKLIGEKVKNLRAKLTSIQLKRLQLHEDIRLAEENLQKMKQKESQLEVDIEKWHDIEVLNKANEQIKVLQDIESRELNTWRDRLKLLAELNDALRPLKGIEPMSASQCSGQQSTGSSLSTLALIEEIRNSHDLKQALRPLAGKESTLLPSNGSVAMCVKQLLQVLKYTPGCDEYPDGTKPKLPSILYDDISLSTEATFCSHGLLPNDLDMILYSVNEALKSQDLSVFESQSSPTSHSNIPNNASTGVSRSESLSQLLDVNFSDSTSDTAQVLVESTTDNVIASEKDSKAHKDYNKSASTTNLPPASW